MKKKKKTSLADIATALGVSKTLVSMVLNNKGDENGINQETQKRVWEMAKELNYKPNQMARSLRLGKSHTLGLIVADISNQFYAKICRAAEDEARAHGYQVLFSSSEEIPEREEEQIQMLRDRQVDGLIVATTLNNQKDILELKEDNFPLVLIDRFMPKVETNYVGVDNVKGSMEMTEHLVRSGFDKIGLLTIGPSHLSSITDRHLGYKEALKKHKIKYDKNLVREIPFDDIKNSMYKEVKDLIMPPHSARALYCTNNNLAIHCMTVLNDMNIRIPQDVALVCFDDIELFKFCYPPVTAVAQPIEEIGKQAVELLLKKIEKKGKGEASYEHLILDTELVIRRSCGSFLKTI